jgi:hypothetical protein
MLNKAPKGQIERHQDFITHSSSPSNTGKSTSSGLGKPGEKSLIAAKTKPKKSPIGQNAQNTGNLNKNDDNNTPPRTA